MTDETLKAIRDALAFVNNERQNRQCSDEDESHYIAEALEIEAALTAAIAGVERLSGDLTKAELRAQEWAESFGAKCGQHESAIAERDAAIAEHDATARIIGDFMLVPPDGGDLKLHEGAQAMKDALSAAIAKRDGLIEALTPSAGTKFAYIAEFQFTIDYVGDTTREVTVPWSTTKQIMKAILSRGTLAKDAANG